MIPAQGLLYKPFAICDGTHHVITRRVNFHLNESNPRRPASQPNSHSFHPSILYNTSRLQLFQASVQRPAMFSTIQSRLYNIAGRLYHSIGEEKKKESRMNRRQREQQQERRCAETTGTGQDRMNVCFGLCSRTQERQRHFLYYSLNT